MNRPPLDIPNDVRAALNAARVGRMAVLDEHGVPSIVTVCFVLEGQTLLIAQDNFPEGIAQLREQQMAALAGNPNITVLVDHWEENWNKLGMVMLRGIGEVLPGASLEQRRVLSLLRDKYAQYRGVNMKDEPMIRLDILSMRYWGELAGLHPQPKA